MQETQKKWKFILVFKDKKLMHTNKELMKGGEGCFKCHRCDIWGCHQVNLQEHLYSLYVTSIVDMSRDHCYLKM